jgi:hypothetical protein
LDPAVDEAFNPLAAAHRLESSLMREYGVTAEDVCKRALALLENRGRLKAEPWRRIGNRRQTDMTKRFNVGDHVTWNSEAGHVSGRIIKVHKKKS